MNPYPFITANILADSIRQGIRLTTYWLEYPRKIHGELMTHRLLSRNAESSRAVPAGIKIQQVRENPVLPIAYLSAKKGMQGGEALSESDKKCAASHLSAAAKHAAQAAERLLLCNIHHTEINRILEPFTTIKVIVSATDWENFFRLRTADDAEPHMRELAQQMQRLYDDNKPVEVAQDGWHIPFDEPWIDDIELRCKISVARCARVSYGHFSFKNLGPEDAREIDKDVALFNRLKENGHWSPFEHVAQFKRKDFKKGNFRGWKQLRFVEGGAAYG